LPIVVLIDELERIVNPEVKKDLAELIRLVSEEPGTRLKFVLVGIAKTASELTAGHPSVQRCLRELRIGRLKDDVLETIIQDGTLRLDLAFSREARKLAALMSSGYPYFTHLLALKACEDAIGEGRKTINVNHLEAATAKAVNDAEGKLRSAYELAIGDKENSAQYRKILLAAAAASATNFSAAQLRFAYAKVWREDISSGRINPYMRRLASDGAETIFRRLATGVYQFNDPRMPSYIRIAQFYNEETRDVDVFEDIDVSRATDEAAE
jgi:hypothetical protein